MRTELKFSGRPIVPPYRGVSFLKGGGVTTLKPILRGARETNVEISIPNQDLFRLIRALGRLCGLETCTFLPASSLIPKGWLSFWTIVSDDGHFERGSHKHSLVTASSFADFCATRLKDNGQEYTAKGIDLFLRKLRSLGEVHIDLET